MIRLALSFLGGFQVHLDGRPVSEFKSGKARALLAFLAVEAARPHRRETLAGLLWPERTDRDAHNNLRYTLANVRKVIGDRTADPPFLLISRDAIQFNRNSSFWLDVAELEAQTGNALARWPADTGLNDLKAVLSRYCGGFLEGLSVGDAAPFEEWVVLRREQIAHQVMVVLGKLVTDLTARGELSEAEAFARQQVALEPWNEEAQRSLMRALALGGQRNAALHQFQACRRILDEDLGVEPAEETIALYQAIRAAEWGDSSTRRPARSPNDRPERGFAEHWPTFATIPACSPVVARESQLHRLHVALKMALDGSGHVLFVTGETGSGKTVLVDEFSRRAMQAHPGLLVARGACDAANGVGDPYLPFREIFQLLTGDIEAKRAGSTLTRDHAGRLWAAIPDAMQSLVSEGPDLIDIFVPGSSLELRVEAFARQNNQVARLKELLHRRTGNGEGARPSIQLADIFDQATHVMQTLARRYPLCLVLDDLQWADAASVSLLFHLGRCIASSRILVIAAYRPDAIASPSDTERHPLRLVVNELQRISGQEPIDLDACDGAQFIDALLDSEPNSLGAGFREMLGRLTEGHPLFTVELLRSMEAQGSLVRDEQGRWSEGPSLQWRQLPTRVEAAIAERIDRLPDNCRVLLDTASIEGQEFTAEVVAGALSVEEREVIHCLSSRLDERHRLVSAASYRRLGNQTISRYRFRHHLFQRYLYEHLDAVRRATLHEAIGSALETLYAEAPDELNALAPRLAWHFEMADRPELAARYYLQAGRRATSQAAHEDAVSHLNRGLALLETLPLTPERVRLQMELWLAVVSPLSYTRGFWSVESRQALEQAAELSRHPSLVGNVDLWTVSAATAYFALWSAEPTRALKISEQLLRQGEANQDVRILQWAHCLIGFAFVLQGQFSPGLDHLNRALDYHNHAQPGPQNLLFGIDVNVMARAWKSVALWVLGYPDQANQCLQAVLSAAQDGGNAISLAHVRSMASFILFLCARDPAAASQQVQALRASSKIVRPFGALADSLSGTDAGDETEDQQALHLMRQGLATYQETGTGLGRAGQLLLHAQRYAAAGHVQAGLDILDNALAWMSASGMAGFEAEGRRLRGELTLMDPFPHDRTVLDAAASFRDAIDVARRQQARWWELRATVSLYRLMHEFTAPQDPHCIEANQMLARIYESFSEGFDTPDLREARALLEVAVDNRRHSESSGARPSAVLNPL